MRMKLGIVGKGGVGKTTTSALIAQVYAERGKRVLAIDTDSNPNLAISLGLDAAQADAVPLLPRALVVGSGDGRITPADLIKEYGADTPDVTLVDMEAGLEHLSRSGGTLAYADVLLVIMEPTRKSILTAGRTITLAAELGIPRVYGVGNKANLPDDAEFFREVCSEYSVPLAGIIPDDPDVAQADRSGSMLPPEKGLPVREAIQEILDFVDTAVLTPAKG
jgi:CO dehydrogenase maturation factor